jgi:hypothetical protein
VSRCTWVITIDYATYGSVLVLGRHLSVGGDRLLKRGDPCCLHTLHKRKRPTIAVAQITDFLHGLLLNFTSTGWIAPTLSKIIRFPKLQATGDLLEGRDAILHRHYPLRRTMSSGGRLHSKKTAGANKAGIKAVKGAIKPASAPPLTNGAY